MDWTHRARKAPHIVRVLGVGAIAGAALAVGCGAKVAIDRDGGLVAAGGGGAGTTTTGGGAGGAHSDAGCSLGSSGAGAGQLKATECFATPPDGCPNQYDAVMHIVPSTPCVYLVSVDCGPLILTDQCCYVVTEEKKTCGAG